MTIGPLFKTPASSPPPKHPLVTAGTPSSATLASVGSKSPLSVVGGRESFQEGATALVQPTPSAAPLTGTIEERYAHRARDFVPLAAVGPPTGGYGGGTTAGLVGPGASSNNGAGNVTGVQQSK